jgi:hypothetical protein
MTWYFYYFLLNIRLNKMTFLYDDLFWSLLVYWFLYFDNYSFGFLAIAMLWEVDWFLYENFCYFWYFYSFNYWSLYFDELDFFLHDYVMNWLFNYLEFLLFVNHWNTLLDFYYFAYLSTDTFWNFLLDFYLLYLSLSCMVGYFNLLNNSLCRQKLLFSFHCRLLNDLNEFFLRYGDFNYIYFLIKFNYLFNNFCWHWISFLNCYWNLDCLCSSIFKRNFLAVWNTFFKVYCKMSSI